MRDPYRSLVETLPLNEAHAAWFSMWALCHFLTLVLLQESHKKANIKTERQAYIISLSIFVLIFVQIVGFIDETFLNFVVLDKLYRWSIPSINIAMGMYMIFALLSDFYNGKRINTHRSF